MPTINKWITTGVLALTLVMSSGLDARAAITDEAPDAAAIGIIDQTTENTPVVVPAPAPTVQEALLHVCESRGYGEACAKTLLGMLWNESSNRSTVIGDNGRARGYFQIHYKMHNVSIECAEDLICSANWTLTYLESNSYPRYVSYAIQCHNSCNVNNGYAAKAIRNGNYFWNKPLVITQEAPVEIAMK